MMKTMPLANNEKRNSDSIIKVIGVGGGGGNAVANMFKQGIQGVDFAVCNTDIQALENSPVENVIQLGPDLTEGRGAGSKPEIGKKAALESVEEIRAFLNDGTKMLFVTAGMGGGTGTGAAPVVAGVAKEMGVLTVAIATLPFKFEGNRRHRYAIEGLEELKSSVDAFLVISNDRLSEIHGNLALSAAFSQADHILTTAARGIAEIITVPGYINVDFEDVNTVMRGSGIAIMGSAIAEGDDRAQRAIDAAMNSPLLEDNDIRGAQHILLNITSGKKEVTMNEICEITDYVQEEAGYGTNIIWGNCFDEALGDKLCVTLIATGFRTQDEQNQSVDEFQTEDMREPKRIALDDASEEGISRNTMEPKNTNSSHSNSNVFDFEQDDVRKTIEELNNHRSRNQATQSKMMHDDYRRLEDLRRSYMRKALSTNFDNPQAINQMENEPAYKRRRVRLEDMDDERTHGRNGHYEVGDDNDQPLRKGGNSFLHENVD